MNKEDLIKEVEYGVYAHKDIITSNGKRYVAGEWNELEYAKQNGFEFVGTVAELAREFGLI